MNMWRRRGGRSAGASSLGALSVWLALACLALTACGKSAGGAASPPDSAGRERAADREAGAALLARIPSDTPYVLASYEPVPHFYWRQLAPLAKMMLDAIPPSGSPSDPAERFGSAFLRDLRANLNEAGLRRVFGLGRGGRFALYGIGVVIVTRVGLVDSKALLATIERLQSESGLALPVARHRGLSYWRFHDDEDLVVAAVLADELVVAVGPTDALDRALPLVLGTERPTSSMADTKLLERVAARHGLAGYGVGYIDTARMLQTMITAEVFTGEEAVPPGCLDQVAVLAKRLPRLAFGYEEIAASQVTVKTVLEMDAALSARFKRLAVEVPGLVAGLPADEPLFALGFGLDQSEGLRFATDMVDGMERIAGACGGAEAFEEMRSARAKLSTPLPPSLAKVSGLFLSVKDFALDADGKPSRADAYMVLATPDPLGLLALAKQLWPASKGTFEVAADGEFHDVSVPSPIAFQFAVRRDSLVFAMGKGMAESAQRALSRTGPSPFLYGACDCSRLMTTQMVPSRPWPTVGQEEFWSKFGMWSFWVHPTGHGVAGSLSMQLK
jgi:hypothetical protein